MNPHQQAFTTTRAGVPEYKTVAKKQPGPLEMKKIDATNFIAHVYLADRVCGLDIDGGPKWLRL